MAVVNTDKAPTTQMSLPEESWGGAAVLHAGSMRVRKRGNGSMWVTRNEQQDGNFIRLWSRQVASGTRKVREQTSIALGEIILNSWHHVLNDRYSDVSRSREFIWACAIP